MIRGAPLIDLIGAVCFRSKGAFCKGFSFTKGFILGCFDDSSLLLLSSHSKLAKLLVLFSKVGFFSEIRGFDPKEMALNSMWKERTPGYLDPFIERLSSFSRILSFKYSDRFMMVW